MTQVKDVMIRKVVATTGSASLEDVCNILIRSKLSGIPVIDRSKKLIGFISEKDIITAFSKKIGAKKVKDVMNENVCFIEDGLTLDRVSKIFSAKNYRRLPVVKDGKLIGIVSRKDIISHLVEHYY